MTEQSLTSAKSSEQLQYGFTAQEVVRYIDSLHIQPSDNLRIPSLSNTMNIGIAQVAMRPYNSLPDYIREMDFIIRQGVNQRAHLIAFPALSGLLPASLFPQYSRVMKNIQMDSRTNLPHSVWINQGISAVASECFEVFFSTMSALAAAYGVYIMTGSTIYPENGTFYHRAFVFDPEGKFLGYQDKMVVGSLERDLQIEAGGEIKLFTTPVGNFTILIGSDVNHFETTHVSRNLGTKIILNPTAFMEPYTGVNAAEGLNLRVQEKPMFGIQSTLIGQTPFGFNLEAPSGVFGPLRFSLPNAKNGMYLRTMKHRQTQILTVRIDTEALSNVSDPLTEDDSTAFLEKYIDRLF